MDKNKTLIAATAALAVVAIAIAWWVGHAESPSDLVRNCKVYYRCPGFDVRGPINPERIMHQVRVVTGLYPVVGGDPGSIGAIPDMTIYFLRDGTDRFDEKDAIARMVVMGGAFDIFIKSDKGYVATHVVDAEFYKYLINTYVNPINGLPPIGKGE